MCNERVKRKTKNNERGSKMKIRRETRKANK